MRSASLGWRWGRVGRSRRRRVGRRRRLGAGRRWRRLGAGRRRRRGVARPGLTVGGGGRAPRHAGRRGAGACSRRGGGAGRGLQGGRGSGGRRRGVLLGGGSRGGLQAAARSAQALVVVLQLLGQFLNLEQLFLCQVDAVGAQDQPIASGHECLVDGAGIRPVEGVELGDQECGQQALGRSRVLAIQDGQGFVLGVGQVAEHDVLDQPFLGVVPPVSQGVGAVRGRGGRGGAARLHGGRSERGGHGRPGGGRWCCGSRGGGQHNLFPALHVAGIDHRGQDPAYGHDDDHQDSDGKPQLFNSVHEEA